MCKAPRCRRGPQRSGACRGPSGTTAHTNLHSRFVLPQIAQTAQKVPCIERNKSLDTRQFRAGRSRDSCPEVFRFAGLLSSPSECKGIPWANAANWLLYIIICICRSNALMAAESLESGGFCHFVVPKIRAEFGILPHIGYGPILANKMKVGSRRFLANGEEKIREEFGKSCY